MSLVSVLTTNLVVLGVAFAVMFLVCFWLRDPTPIDAYWGIGMGVLATSTFLQLPEPTARSLLILLLCWLWALRLAAYMLWRWKDHGPDRRYMRMMEKAEERRGWGVAMSMFALVVLPQALLQYVIALPVQLGQISPIPPVLGMLAWIGATLAVFGLGWETIADIQLTRFRKRAQNSGKVMSSGLWRYSRHPNYFGEVCFWWGLFLISAETAIGAWSVISPLLLTWILFKWSGLPTMEHRMRKHKPGYAEYVDSTSAIIPMPPARRSNESS